MKITHENNEEKSNQIKSPATLADILEARQILKGVILRTPMEKSSTFSKMLGNEIWIKYENLQKTGAFKIRGAYNKIAHLTEEERKRGVIACSTGNHAQGVAYAASLFNTKAIIVMPKGTPLPKIQATRNYGAEVILAGDCYDDAYAEAERLVKERNLSFVHPFEDRYIIAGQGTIGLEILEDLPDIDVFVCPIGGGGLISGIAMALKAARPNVKVIGVEAKGANSAYLSLKNGKITQLDNVSTIADGIAVKRPGDLTFSLLKQYVDDIVTVDEDEIARAILMLLERCKTVAEGAGAVSIAALVYDKLGIAGKNKKVVALISGGNIDINMIGKVIRRGLIKAGRYIQVSVLMADKPGRLDRLLDVVAKNEANVLSINTDRIAQDIPMGMARIILDLETASQEHSDELIKKIKKLEPELQV
ncbi:MAG: threonine ammonia-lyase [Thermoplasmata archaeon]